MILTTEGLGTRIVETAGLHVVSFGIDLTSEFHLGILSHMLPRGSSCPIHSSGNRRARAYSVYSRTPPPQMYMHMHSHAAASSHPISSIADRRACMLQAAHRLYRSRRALSHASSKSSPEKKFHAFAAAGSSSFEEEGGGRASSRLCAGRPQSRSIARGE